MLGIVLTVHVLLAIGIIGLVLMQHGKGADAGAAFGSGASGTVFGAAGAGSFLVKATTFAAILFFLTSIGMAYIVDGSSKPSSVTEMDSGVPAPAEQAAPAKGKEKATSDVPEID